MNKELSEEESKLKVLVHGLGWTIEEFLIVANAKYSNNGKEVKFSDNPVLVPFASALIAIQNLTLQAEKHKEDVDALNLRLDLMNVPRDCTEEKIIQ